MGNEVAPFDISGPEPRELGGFHSSLFGWTLTDGVMNYSILDTQAGHGINGGSGTPPMGPAYQTV